jgi:Fe2+ or Zn2+ uptake regulation protein
MNKVWGPRPLNLAVVEVLQRKGPLADSDLLDEVKETYGEISFRELNKALLKLELSGILRVTRLMKGKRRVELVGARQP